MKTIFFFIINFLFFNSMLFAQQKTLDDIKIHGRIHYDYEFLKRDYQSDWFNGNEFRRIYLSVSGVLSSHLSYKIESDFSHGDIALRDVYVKYNVGQWGNFVIGSLAEPTGLEVLTSSKYISFVERAMLSSLQNSRWGSGFHYQNFGLLGSKMNLQIALTHNGVDKEGFEDDYLETGINFVARLSAPVIKNEEVLLHLGLNYASRPEAGLSFRPENHMGEKYTYVFPGSQGRDEWGFEMAGVYKNFSLQSEYKIQSVDNNLGNDYSTQAFYLMGSYFLTGEHRPYKNASFGRVKPKKDIDHEGFGAIEVLARFSGMTFSDDLVLVNPDQPASIHNFTFGINWYLTSHARLMYNYVLTDDEEELLGNLKGHLIRFQIDF